MHVSVLFAYGPSNVCSVAWSYLDYVPLSASGLENQLVYDGFTRSQARNAIAFLDVDWNIQAARRTGEYIRASTLISQDELYYCLVQDGFSKEQVEYGLSKYAGRFADIGGEVNWNRLAVERAAVFLLHAPYSRKGLVEQLVFDGFSPDQAEFGVAHCRTSWSAQALRKANTLMLSENLAKPDLMVSLLYEGFTMEEAEYGSEECFAFVVD